MHIYRKSITKEFGFMLQFYLKLFNQTGPFYILRCADNSFYIGHTDDLEKRMAEHMGGEGCVYFRSYPFETFSSSMKTLRNCVVKNSLCQF